MVNQLIKVKQETKDKLDKLKVHPRQPYDEVIDQAVSGSHSIPIKKLKKEVQKKD